MATLREIELMQSLERRDARILELERELAASMELISIYKDGIAAVRKSAATTKSIAFLIGGLDGILFYATNKEPQ